MTGKEMKLKLMTMAEVVNLNPTYENVGEVMGGVENYKDFFDDYGDIISKLGFEALMIVKELEAMDFTERFKYYYPSKR